MTICARSRMELLNNIRQLRWRTCVTISKNKNFCCTSRTLTERKHVTCGVQMDVQRAIGNSKFQHKRGVKQTAEQKCIFLTVLCKDSATTRCIQSTECRIQTNLSRGTFKIVVAISRSKRHEKHSTFIHQQLCHLLRLAKFFEALIITGQTRVHVFGRTSSSSKTATSVLTLMLHCRSEGLDYDVAFTRFLVTEFEATWLQLRIESDGIQYFEVGVNDEASTDGSEDGSQMPLPRTVRNLKLRHTALTSSSLDTAQPQLTTTLPGHIVNRKYHLRQQLRMKTSYYTPPSAGQQFVGSNGQPYEVVYVGGKPKKKKLLKNAAVVYSLLVVYKTDVLLMFNQDNSFTPVKSTSLSS
ncbi:hypothetical protein CLF_105248 [Clonorchis sinensis]|uniref:Uncharacterized protein n=1 Tax=Clonorchis sinensis TaxID=79923 RepID=G7YP52_CLOSI|nr:hypothetical protein CLF_105248 [Clonorchis sinensis]